MQEELKEKLLYCDDLVGQSSEVSWLVVLILEDADRIFIVFGKHGVERGVTLQSQCLENLLVVVGKVKGSLHIIGVYFVFGDWED